MSDQTEVIAFLMAPESYPGNAGEVVRIDTHCAAVFLAGGYAYKLKRAVKLPYLDFSTVAKRRKFCERELEINRLTAPQLYLRVALIVRDAAGKLQIGGEADSESEGESEGEVVDWLLVMKRFDNGAIFDRLALGGGLNPPLMAKLARTIWRFHARSAVISHAAWVPSLERIAGDVGNTLCNADAVAIGVDFRATLEKLRAAVQAKSVLLAARQAAGYVRRCHGDLHLNNIVLIDDEPTLFDAIEFDEEFATIDVLYDLAFLIMDLWHRGMRPEASAVINHYFQRDVPASEWDGFRLLPLFLSLRAAIRAMVGMHRLLLNGVAERRATRISIHSYARLAGDMLAPRPVQLIVIGGLSGSGKTTLAQMIAPYVGAVPGAIHLRTDVERKLLHGVDLQHRLPPEVYTPESRNLVYRRTLARAESVLGAEHSVVLDAVFPEAHWREAVRELAARTGAHFKGFWLEADAVQMMARVTHRAVDASDADPQVVAEQLHAATTPADWTRISTRGSLTEAADAILAVLRAGLPDVREQ